MNSTASQPTHLFDCILLFIFRHDANVDLLDDVDLAINLALHLVQCKQLQQGAGQELVVGPTYT